MATLLPTGYVVPPPTFRWGEDLTDGPTWLYANHTMFIKWQRAGGDYWDSAGGLNGAAHWAISGPASSVAGDKTFDVTALISKLIADNTGFYVNSNAGNPPRLSTRHVGSLGPPKLTVVTTGGTVALVADADVELNQTTGNCLGTGLTAHTPFLLHFDLPQLVGSVISASLMVHVESTYGNVQTMTVDQVAMPKVLFDPMTQAPQLVQQGIAMTVAKDSDLKTHPSVLSYSQFTQESDMWDVTQAGHTNDWNYVSSTYPGDGPPRTGSWPGRTFVDWPFYGLKALRVVRPAGMINNDGSSISTAHKVLWRPPFSFPIGGGPRDMYCRYLFKIDHDVFIGMNELGVKMPGMDSNTVLGGVYPNAGKKYVSGMSARMEHSKQSPANPHLWELRGYHYECSKEQRDNIYGLFLNPTYAPTLAVGFPVAVSDRVHCLEQHIKLNTSTNTLVGTVVKVGTYADGTPLNYNDTFTQRQDPNDLTLWWNNDGVYEFWLDGVLCRRDTNRLIIANKNLDMGSIIWSNFYHGGTGATTAAIHYEWSGVVCSTEYVGPPRPQMTTATLQTTRTKLSTALTEANAAVQPSVAVKLSAAIAEVDAVSGGVTWPLWRRNLANDGLWHDLGPTTSLSTFHFPTPITGGFGVGSIVNAWNGGAGDSSGRFFLMASGGHVDSDWNGMLMLDLRTDPPAWILLRDQSPVRPPADLGNYPYYPDGAPGSRHTYSATVFCAQRNRVFTVGNSAPWHNSSKAFPYLDAFDLATNTYDPQGTWPNTPFMVGQAMATAIHPVTGDIYIGQSGQFGKWTQAINTWTKFTVAGGPSWQYGATCIDAGRDRWVRIGGSTLQTLNLSALGSTQPVVTVPLSGHAATNYAHVVHDTDNDRYIYVTAVDPSQGSTLFNVYVIPPAGGVATKFAQPFPGALGPCSKMAYFKDLGGIALYPKFLSNVWFLPTRSTP